MAGSTQKSLLPCGNTERIVDGQTSPCPNAGASACSGCFLVQYCSKECQIAHRNTHKLDCKSPMIKETWRPSWDVERRFPAFINNNSPSPLLMGQDRFGQRKYLWGNVPAIDLINAAQNEGDNLPQKLNLLFAASGDIRNVVKSLASLPHTYSGKCQVVINDRDFDIVARNAILLLIALIFDPSEAPNMMLHIWYSAFVPKEMFSALQQKILPLIQDVCSKILNKPVLSLQSKTWTYGSRSLRLVLQKEIWDLLPSYLQSVADLSMEQAQSIMTVTTLAPERKDYLERAMYNQPPAWRVCIIKFRKDGVLLPFGRSRKEFDTPNPTFYQSRDFWPMMDSANPLEGWPLHDVMKWAPLAKNDIFGSLFLYLIDILKSFCVRLQSLQVNFHLFQFDAVELSSLLGDRGMHKSFYDRIEVSNICDRGYLGPQKTLEIFAPMLKPRSQNPHATILMLFLNAVQEEAGPMYWMPHILDELERLKPYLKIDRNMLTNSNNADFHRVNDARSLVRNYEKPFKQVMEVCRFDKIGKNVGMKMKGKNTVVEKWPLALGKGAGKRKFDILQASGHDGSERYVEWESSVI